MTIDTTTDNQAIIQGAFGSLITSGDTTAVAQILRDDFVHHRPGQDLSKKEWLDAVRLALGHLHDMEVEVLNTVADGDRVVVHSRRRLPDGPEITVVDVARLEGGLIVEAWEVIEPTVQAAANFHWWQSA